MREQQLLLSLLDRIPVWDLSVAMRNSLDAVKQRLSETPDLHGELKSLFKVNGFGDFALSLLWVVERMEKDPMRAEATPEEEALVISKFKQATGLEAPEPSFGGFDFQQDTTPSMPEESASSFGDPFGFSGPSAQPAPLPADDTTAFGGFGSPVPAPVAATGSGEEHGFSEKLERFLEAVQSGTDERMGLLEELKADCQTVMANSPLEEFRQFCQLLYDLLDYININQYLDDVRVMNLVTNIQDPFAQWAKAEPDARPGLLDPATEMLRDFRSMFE